MYRFVKVKDKLIDYNEWFLVLEPNIPEPCGLSERKAEEILRRTVKSLHGGEGSDPSSIVRLQKEILLVATRELDYEKLAAKYGTLLIREIGSFMKLMDDHVITEEYFGESFPTGKIGNIVICENDARCEYAWAKYLIPRFPSEGITTINFFDLRNDQVLEMIKKSRHILTLLRILHFQLRLVISIGGKIF